MSKQTDNDNDFYQRLIIEPGNEVEALRTIVQEYYKEAHRKIATEAKLLAAQRKKQDRYDELFLELRERKEKEKLTEATIKTAISVDATYTRLCEEVELLDLAVKRQGHRLEAIRMKASALKILAESVRTDKMLSGGLD